nr:hypothetical protein CFP56_30387 [Quercus suber]
MPLERKNGSSLHELLAGRSRGSASKDAWGSLLLRPPPSPVVSSFAPVNMRKRKKDKEMAEERELVHSNEGVPPKVPKTVKGKQMASLAKSKEAELDGAAIPWNSTIREFHSGNAHYLANALEQPFLLPKDITALKNLKQHDLFLSLKRDLARLSSSYLIGYSFVVFVQGLEANQGKEAISKTKESELVKPPQEKKAT